MRVPVVGVDLPPGHRVPERFARILARPHRRDPGRARLPRVDLIPLRRRPTEHHLVEAYGILGRLEARNLAEVVVLFRRRQPGMGIGRSDDAELERVDAELLLVGEAALVGFARVLARVHVRRRRFGAKVGLVKALEVRKLVGRRERRMCFAVAFHLRDFVERLPPAAARGVVAVERLLRRERHSSNIRPAERFPLCGIASTLPPVFCS